MGSKEWADFRSAICDAEKLIELQRGGRWPEDSLIAELRFLYVFVGYAMHWWSTDDNASSSHNTSNNYVESLFFKIKEFEAYLQRDFLGIDNFITTKPSQMFRVLYQEIDLLKTHIKEAYRAGSLSATPTTTSHPPSPTKSSQDWFYLKANVRVLSKPKLPLDLGDPLRKQMDEMANTLIILHHILSAVYYQDWSPWKDNMMGHFGRMVVQVAHLCCLCWYNPPLMDDENHRMQQDMAVSLSDLNFQMDPDTPEFLDTSLGFLGHCDDRDWRLSVSSFVSHTLGAEHYGGALHKELVSLVTCFIKVAEMQDTDDVHRAFAAAIKDVFADARYLNHKYRREHTADFAILLANIWTIKAEIVVEIGSTVLTLSLDDHIRALLEGRRFLELLCFPINENSAEYEISKLLKGLPKQLQSLYQSSPAKEEDILVHMKISNLLFKSLVQITLLKAKALLLKLLKKDAGLVHPLKRKIGTLQEGLFFLIHSETNHPKKSIEDEKLILADFGEVATEVISLCNTFLEYSLLTEEQSKSMDIWLLDLLEKVQHLKTKLKGLFLRIPKFNLPKTPGLCFIQLLLQNLRKLLSHKHDSLAHATHQIEDICRDLEFIVSIFQDVIEQGIEKEECKDLHTQLAEMSYQVEHVIELMLGESKVVWQHSLLLYHLAEEIRHLKLQLSDSDGKNNYDDGVHNVSQRLMHVVPQITTTTTEEVMVGLNDQKEKVIDQLTRGMSQRGLVSIVGMPGIGKTTLARHVFCSPHVFYHFPIRAWCCVSQTYRKRDLLLDILGHIITVTDYTHAMSDEDLHLMLYRHLKKNRYLIVMDDVWSTEAWDDLQLSFPNDLNSSRILLTSRLQDVVSRISDAHLLRPLSEEESWELLKIRIFCKEECPEALLKVGQQIAKSCQGLPLAICAIAGFLNRTCGKNQDFWKQTAKSVSLQIVNDPETQCRKILELSYNHLPDHLKACLLYFGAFPEDKDVQAWRLQCLWIAEGFVHKLGPKSVDDQAEDYLVDLVARSLVIVGKRRSNGKVKTCRVHDVVRDLCLLKAKDDKFLQLLSGNDEPYSSFDCLARDVPLELLNISNSRAYEEYRLCFCVNREHFVVSRPSGPFVRSLLFFAATDMYPRCPFDISFIPNNFKRLRVLDLESINMGSSLANGIELLIELRYLAVCGDMESIPSSLSNLQNLEILLVKGLRRKVRLPETIWGMTKLRHIHVTDFAIFTFAKDGSSSRLDSLVSLSFPCFRSGEATNDVIMRFPNLQKLKCVFLELGDVPMNFFQFPTLESLCKLESLKISYYGKVLSPGELNFPSRIKKLTLSNFRMPWSHISAVGRLQNLEVLKLTSRAFEGSDWDMTEGEFVNLKYLRLDMLDIVHWNASGDHLPQLQQLLVQNCEKLTEVPFDFVSISTLQKIEVQQCAVSVEESVRRIEEEGFEGIKIVINSLH